MKILIFSLIFPLPPDSGARIRIFNIIKKLSQDHDLVLLAPADPEKDPVSELKKYCQEVETVHLSSGMNLKGAVDRLKSFVLQIPFIPSRELKRSIGELLKKYSFDLIQIEKLHLAPYLPLFSHLPTVLDEFDIDSISYKRKLVCERNPLKKIRLFIQWLRVKEYERRVIPRFKKVVVVSEKDKELLLSASPQINASVVPNGVDLEYFKPEDGLEEPNTLFFTGLMVYPPNVDAMLQFCKKTLPLIREKIPDIQLYIIGGNPPQEIRSLSRIRNIFVTGYMDDVRSVLNKCQVCIVPLRIAAGTRLKILEAMAMRKPVVSTTIGAEGLEVSPGENIIIADTPEDFAKKTVDVLKNSALRERLILGGRRLVESRYSWEACLQKLEAVYKELNQDKIR